VRESLNRGKPILFNTALPLLETHMVRWNQGARIGVIAVVSCAVMGGCASMRSQATNEKIARMVSEYDEGMSAAEKVSPDSTDAAANIRVPYQQVRHCREDHPIEVRDYPDVEVQTSRGTKTLKQMADECAEMEKKIRAQSYRGCGEKRIYLTSHVDGTGAWTRPTLQSQDDEYIPKPCDKMGEAPLPPSKDFESAHAGLQGLCGPSARIYYPKEWQHRTNALGVAVQRQASATCKVIDETRPKWWMESF
jgi:hypothetical protein